MSTSLSKLVAALAAFVIVGRVAPCFADDAPIAAVIAPPVVVVDAPPPPPADKQHAVSLTFSPLNLVLPEVKVMAEVRITRKFSAAGIGGLGSVGVSSRGGPVIGSGAAERFLAWEAGLQGRYYLVGTFEHGMDIGLQGEYLAVSSSARSGSGVSVLGSGSGLLGGPFIGYKLATRVGFTLDLQGGVAYEIVSATASAAGQAASASASAWAPIINVNLGWSF